LAQAGCFLLCRRSGASLTNCWPWRCLPCAVHSLGRFSGGARAQRCWRLQLRRQSPCRWLLARRVSSLGWGCPAGVLRHGPIMACSCRCRRALPCLRPWPQLVLPLLAAAGVCSLSQLAWLLVPLPPPLHWPLCVAPPPRGVAPRYAFGRAHVRDLEGLARRSTWASHTSNFQLAQESHPQDPHG